MMQTYFKAIEGQTPNPEWEARLDGLSKKIRGLKGKATEQPEIDSGAITGDATQ